MSDEHPPDEFDAELAQQSSGALRVDSETGERRLEGLISREHLAQALFERDELGAIRRTDRCI